MAKWISPLFTDIRNKLGDSVVFSNWKGRPYFRAYVIPANPKTAKQRAHRAVLAALVARYQQVIVSDDEVAAWNKAALSFLISGYNLWTKYGRKTIISCVTGSAPNGITVTYTLGMPAGQASLLLFDTSAETWSDETPAEGLVAGEDVELNVEAPAAETEYICYIATDEVLIGVEEQPQDYTAFTSWSLDLVNGLAVEAKCTSAAAT